MQKKIQRETDINVGPVWQENGLKIVLVHRSLPFLKILWPISWCCTFIVDLEVR